MLCSRTHRVSRTCINVLGLLLLAFAPPLFGQRPWRPDTLVPPLVSFGGSLTDSNGKALSGVVGVTFAVYKEQQGGAPLWLETQNVTADKTGHYSVQLGSTSAHGLPPDLFQTGEERWLAVQMIGEPEHGRILLVSVPYALKAGDAATVGGLPASAFALAAQRSPGNSPSAPAKAGNVTASPAAAAVSGSGTTGYVPRWTGSTTLGNSLIFQTATGLMGLGTTAPAAKLDASGGTAVGLRGTTTGSNAGAVWGDATSATGVTIGVRGTSASTAGTGVSGNAIATTGANIGVSGHSSSTTGTGNLGSADATSGATIGVLGRVASSAGTAGVFNNAAAGKELSGQAKGVENFSVDGHGNVKGAAASFSAIGTTAGVTAQGAQTQTSSPVSDGVDALGGSAIGGNGGVGVKASGGTGLTGGAAVMATGGAGLDGGGAGAGISASGGNVGSSTGGDGIDAFAGMGGAGSGFAGSFTGNVTITGSLSVSGTKHFKIDDPLDPANKYLYHAALESSEVLDLYSGNTVLDQNGVAVVRLPGWFEALNTDFRYQLTAIGGAAPNLHVAQEVHQGSFSIAGGAPGIKVSWQITGVRNDAWEKAHPMAVEVNKPLQERGHYMHPELFGAPPEQSIDWARHPQLMQQMREMQLEQHERLKTSSQANKIQSSSVVKTQQQP